MKLNSALMMKIMMISVNASTWEMKKRMKMVKMLI